MRSHLNAWLLMAVSSLTTTSATRSLSPAESPVVRPSSATRATTALKLPLPALCYAPGTPQDVVERNARQQQSVLASLQSQGFQFADSSRWSCTATDGCGLSQGQVTTLTWNIVPDGTAVKGFGGEPNAGSNLKSFLGGIYGSETNWIAHFQTVFDRWSALTGISYVKVNYDDGLPLANNDVFPFGPGAINVRADIRISGHFIDGNSNTLAYNFFPDVGDMVIDTGDNYYSTIGTQDSSKAFRNILAHEHGHGLGLDHSCPVQQKKLMEPFVSTAFTHAQIDDKLAGWRGYGDDKENNETSGTASNLGSIGNGTATVNELSVDDNSDVDFFKFTVPANKKAAVTVTPVGTDDGLSYQAGAQNSNGTCSVGTPFNPFTINDLAVELKSTDGSTNLASANAFGAGSAENIGATQLPAAGTYFVRVFGGTVNNAQGYQLQVTISDGGPVAVPPTVITTAVTSVTLNSATLNGTVNPNGFTTNAIFEYGLTVAYGTAVSAAPAPGSGTSSVSVSNAIAGLTCGSTYHARLNATNSGGTTNGNDVSFQTAACPPTVTTTAASALTPTTATLNGLINPNGAATNRRFEYGFSASYGTTTADVAIGSGVSPVGASFGATGLTCNSLYHFRVSATNSAGTSNGSDLTFTTGACPPPTVTTNAATSITDSSVALNGSVNPNGFSTNVVFQYGLTNAYGVTTGVTNVGAGVVATFPSVPASDLACNTLYHFRVSATNSAGTSNGSDLTFTTGACPPPPAVTTNVVTSITQTGATLNGTINPNGGATKRRFEYGLTAAYGSTSPDLSIGSVAVAQPVSFVVTGLACNTLYHFRAVGQNSGGTTNGLDLTFTTAACPPPGSGNISAATARSIAMNSTAQDTLDTVRTEIWYKVQLFANRSYQFSAWTVGEDGAAGVTPITVDLFSDGAGTIAATPAPTAVSTDLEGSPNLETMFGQSSMFLPALDGTYRIRVLGAPDVASTSVNLMLRETTLFSPWFFVTTSSQYDGFHEIHNNTSQPVQVTLRAFGTAGTQVGVTHTFTLPANATVAKSTKFDLAVTGDGTFGGTVLTHNGAFGAISANTTTLSTVTGLSFDSPFSSRSPATIGLPIR